MPLLLLLLSLAAAMSGMLTVNVLDVGQGDAILIRSPAGKTVLIDGGTGRRNVAAMLQARDIEQVDLVIATHAHADHIGGLDDVLEALPVRLFGDQGMPHTTATYTRLMQLVEDKGVRYVTLRKGRVFNLDDGVRIEVLGPADPPLSGTRSDLNSNSVVTRLTHGDTCMLFTGDAEDPTEHLILEQGLEPCAVLKVAHHGSEHSTSRKWLATVQPQYALISVGSRNRYKHPADETLLRLERNGVEIYRTDLQGTLRVTSNKKRVRIEPVDEDALLAAAGLSAAPTARPQGKTSRVPVALRESPRQRIPLAVAKATEADGSTLANASGLDINAATLEQLIEVPGIGPKKAEAILRWRAEHGPFSSLSDLDAVPGIGPATLGHLEPRVVFAPTAPSPRK